MQSQSISKRLLLLILDGVGLSNKKQHNALFLAKTPHFNTFLKTGLHSRLKASGLAVGLPPKVMGNSEVGHLTIGSGRILLQDLLRISQFTQKHSFADLPDVQRISQLNGHLHLLGLLSDGCVHASLDHLKSLIVDIYKAFPQKKVSIHIITDGRDTSPYSGKKYALELESFITPFDNVRISSVAGRFYTMDRDKRWDRIQVAYQNITGLSHHRGFSLASEGIQAGYDAGISDEFIKPFQIQGGQCIQEKDQCIIFNFRADRVRQISEALANSHFEAFKRPFVMSPQNLLTFTKYREDFLFPVLFSKEVPENCLGEILSKKGLKQLRIAETEKYAHVTYFFNGGRERPFEGEDRILIPSLQDVATYDQKPQMSTYEITDQMLACMSKYDVIIANFANGDMVGHTGNETAVIKAVEVIDECLGRIVKYGRNFQYDIFITSDHGNCEEMFCSKTLLPLTQHTTNPVPFIWIPSRDSQSRKLLDGELSDIAPTILSYLGYEVPEQMTGHNLIA